MEKYTEPLSDKLNNLLEKIHNGEKSFKNAAEHTDNLFLKKYFERKSKERYDFGNELNIEVTMFGLNNENNGTIAGAVQKTSMDIKSLFSVDNAQSMLETAIAGEKAALEDYNEILNQSSLPLRTRALLLKQKEAIEKDLKTIKKIEDLQ
jgi:uncharacterized protein (TIGR02284 family)